MYKSICRTGTMYVIYLKLFNKKTCQTKNFAKLRAHSEIKLTVVGRRNHENRLRSVVVQELGENRTDE